MGGGTATRAQALEAWKRRWGYFGGNPDKKVASFDDGNFDLRSRRVRQPERKATDNTGTENGHYNNIGANTEKPLDPKVAKLQRKIAAEDAALAAYDPRQEPFVLSAARRRRSRLAVDATAAKDQITQTAYSEDRRKELQAFAPDHYLTKEYGLRTAETGLPFEDQTGMRISHYESSIYLRDAPGEAVQALFTEVYEASDAAKTEGAFDPDRMFFTNSTKTFDKLEAFFGADWDAIRTGFNGELKEIEPGIHVIVFENVLPKKERDALGKYLYSTGSTPSSYDALRSKHGGRGLEPLSGPKAPESLKNDETLGGLAKSEACKTLAAVPTGHPMKTVAGATAKLVAGLETTLAATVADKGEAFNKSRLVDSALKNIESLMAVMPSYLDDTPRFTKLFDVLIDELYLLLATCRPYDGASFKTASEKVIEARAPVLSETSATVFSYSMSSGMGAISNAIQSAVACSGGGISAKVDLLDPKGDKDRFGSANYYELENYLLTSEDQIKSKGSVIVATLNPSTPTTKMGGGAKKAWGVDSVVAEVRKKFDALAPPADEASPLTVVVDITVEKASGEGTDELDKLIRPFETEVDAGLILFVFCKSYQKYPSLGSAKMMSGGVSLVGKDTAHSKELQKSLAAAEKETALMDKDEGQLMTHLLANSGEAELPLLKRAADNAALLASLIVADGSDAYLYGDGLPFAMIPSTEMALAFDSGEEYEVLPAEMLAFKCGVDYRYSFGFQNSSCLEIGESLRLNPGQESPAEIVEQFYALGKLTGTTTPISADKVVGLAHDAADAAFDEVERFLAKGKDKADNGAWRERMERVLLKAGLMTSKEVGLEPKELIRRMAEAKGAKPDKDTAFARKLKLVAAAAQPELTAEQRESDNVDLMKAGLKWGWGGTEEGSDKVEANHLLNIVASCARFSTVFQEPADAKKTMALVDALRDCGMAQVSPATREALLQTRAKSLLDGKPPFSEGDLKTLAACAREMPYSDGVANLFASEIPAAAFTDIDKAESPEMACLSDCFLNRLDLESKLELIPRLIKDIDPFLERAREQKGNADNWTKKAEKSDKNSITCEASAVHCETESQKSLLESQKFELNAAEFDTRGEAAEAKKARTKARLLKEESDLYKAEIPTWRQEVIDHRDKAAERRNTAAEEAAMAKRTLGEAKACVTRAWACVKHLERALAAAKIKGGAKPRETLASKDLGAVEPNPLSETERKRLKTELKRLKATLAKVDPKI